MATAVPGSGPVSLFRVNNKLQSKMNSFREVIARKKLEVRRVSEEMRILIEKKEKELNPTSTRFSQISDAIDSVEREIDIDIPNVKLTWRVDEMKDCINRMCRCDQQILVYNEDTRFKLKWSKCEEGRRDNQLYNPWGIVTNPMNGNIYVIDQSNHRVKIFSREGECIRSVKDDEIKYVQNIIFHNQYIYLQCYTKILKLDQFTGKKKKSKSYDFSLRGICTDSIRIYVGQWKGMNLIVLTLDLIEENRISLVTEFCKQDTEIRDISVSHELFYILLFYTEFPIQAFSREGILTRCVVKEDSINCAFCFCLDRQQNILVADCGDSKVKIFSKEGKLLTQFGEKGSEKSQFSSLIGISLFQQDCIITTDFGKSRDKLQLFYPIY